MSRTAAAENLAEMLEPQGIRVSSIHFGPSAQHSTGLSPESPSINRYVEAFLGSLMPSTVSLTHSSGHFSRPFGTCAGLQLCDIF